MTNVSLPGLLRDKEDYSFIADADSAPAKRVVFGKTYKELYALINAEGFLKDEAYDHFVVEEKSRILSVIHFFLEGSEKFQILVGRNSSGELGAHKRSPSQTIERLMLISQGLYQNEGTGILAGKLAAIGGGPVSFEILQDLNDAFDIVSPDELITTKKLMAGDYSLYIKVNSAAGNYTDEVIVTVGEGKPITNINLSGLLVKKGSVPGVHIADLSTVGGSSTVSYTILSDPADLFQIDGTSLKVKNPVNGNVGNVEVVEIEATDENGVSFSEEFDIIVSNSIYINANGLRFNGADESAVLGTNPATAISGPFTLVMAVKIMSNGYIITNQFASGSFQGMSLEVYGNVFRLWAVEDWGLSKGLAMAIAHDINDQDWHFVTISFDPENYTTGGDGIDLHVDGVIKPVKALVGGGVHANPNLNSGLAFEFGRKLNGSSFFNGELNEFMIVDKVLSTAEVNELWNNVSKDIIDPSQSTFASHIKHRWISKPLTITGNNDLDDAVGTATGSTVNMDQNNVTVAP